MLAAWVHDLNPIALRLGPIPIRWYGLSYALGFLAGWLLLRFMAKRRAVLIPPERAGDAILYAVVGVVVGGRLGYCLFYEPRLLWSFDSQFPWWGLLAINRGGMASHGGMIGVIIAAFFIARLGSLPGAPQSPAPTRRPPVLHILDALALITTPGLLFGRIANFVNGELLGRMYKTPGQPAPWWTVRFPQEVEVSPDPITGNRLDVPAALDRERLLGIDRLLAETGLTGPFPEAYAKLVASIQHGRDDLAAKLAPYLSARYPSQIFQGITEGLVLGAILWLIARRPRLPGVVGCWFLIIYGVLRILTEFGRLPDEQLIHKQVLGLSRGQLLSLAMIAAGVVALILITRRGGPKFGGWARPNSTPEPS